MCDTVDSVRVGTECDSVGIECTWGTWQVCKHARVRAYYGEAVKTVFHIVLPSAGLVHGARPAPGGRSILLSTVLPFESPGCL